MEGQKKKKRSLKQEKRIYMFGTLSKPICQQARKKRAAILDKNDVKNHASLYCSSSSSSSPLQILG